MNNSWLQFLTSDGAVFDNGFLQHFDKAQRDAEDVLNDSIITDLSQYGVIRVHGSDAMNFLQNQLSNDVRKVDEHHHQLGSYCSPKGRMFTVFRLFKIGSDFYIRMPSALIEPVIKRLRMYVLMSKVVLEDISDVSCRVAIAGPNAESALRTTATAIPAEPDTAINENNITVLRVPGEQRFELYADEESMQNVWRKLSILLKPVGHDAWPLLDILNGIPTVFPDTIEHFVPQMTNLHLINGVSFKKGCYPGQEVVARMQYLGKLKRKMYKVSMHTDSAPAPGTAIIYLADSKAHEAGEIVDARTIGRNQAAALAVLQTNAIDKPLKLINENGADLEIGSLPYALSPDQQE